MIEIKTAETAKHEQFVVDENDTVDWHRISFPLGVRTELTETDPPFLALSPEELEVLHKLLTRVLPGADNAASHEYMGLMVLATWARRAREWALKRSGSR
jgi:hypothetical protein